MSDQKDAFDLWWEWAEKPLDSTLTIPAEIHDAVRNAATVPWSTRWCSRARDHCARPAARISMGFRGLLRNRLQRKKPDDLSATGQVREETPSRASDGTRAETEKETVKCIQ
jgi:hypothetical protein